VWHLLESDDRDAERAAADPQDVLDVALKPGQVIRGRLSITAPDVPGRWVLSLDLVDTIDGSFAAGGSAPRTMVIKLVEPRPRTPTRD
jgi:hypothetical protein